MTGLIAIFAGGFASVFLLGFQSRNVNTENYGWASATSFLIAIAQASIWQRIMRSEGSAAQIAVYGLSSALAIVASMWTHQRFIARKGPPA